MIVIINYYHTNPLLGAKKHEAAMKEMARRKTENSKKPTKGINNAAKNATTRVVALPKRGIGAGIKNPNKHLQEFEKMKTSYRKKKGKIVIII